MEIPDLSIVLARVLWSALCLVVGTRLIVVRRSTGKSTSLVLRYNANVFASLNRHFKKVHGDGPGNPNDAGNLNGGRAIDPSSDGNPNGAGNTMKILQ